MKNGDKPINPIKGADDLFYNEQDESYIKQFKPLLGLAKREYFAGLAMQGLLSSFMYNAENGFYGKDVVVSTAIEYADELLKQLEEK